MNCIVPPPSFVVTCSSHVCQSFTFIYKVQLAMGKEGNDNLFYWKNLPWFSDVFRGCKKEHRAVMG